MARRNRSVPPLIPPKSPLLLFSGQHLSQPNLHKHNNHDKRLDKIDGNLKLHRDNNINSDEQQQQGPPRTPHHEILRKEIILNQSAMEIVDQDDSSQLESSNYLTFRRTASLSRRKSQDFASDQLIKSPKKCISAEVLSTIRSKNLNVCVTSSSSSSPAHVSLPLCKLSQLSLHDNVSGSNRSCCDGGGCNNCYCRHPIIKPVVGSGATDIKILINGQEEKLADSIPRRPMKRKSQDYDRNLLSENHSSCGSTNSDFWLPKVKVTPSMVTQLNTQILANFQETVMSTSRDEQHHRRIIQLLDEFLAKNKFLGADERITDAIETISTRILSPSDDEMWTVLTSHKIINVQCSVGSLQISASNSLALTAIKVLGSFSLGQVKRILTDPELSLAYLQGVVPDIVIVTGDSAKTEKLISSILVSALRIQKFPPSSPGLLNESTILPETEKTQEKQESQPLPSTSSSSSCVTSTKSPSTSMTTANNVNLRSMGVNYAPKFLEVANVSILEIPSISVAFKKLFPYEKQVFHSSAVVVRFEQIAPDIEIPVRIQIAAEGSDFRASILRLSGCTLTFCNPIRTFFTFNPGKKLCNIDVSNPKKFSVKRIESPKPNSLLLSHNKEFFLIETGGAQVADDICQRVIAIQQNASIGKSSLLFITAQSLLAFKIHTYENIFQIPLLNLVKLHKPSNQPTTCIMELDSTEAMEDFISSDSPCWSLTFATIESKSKFLQCLHRIVPSLEDER